MATVRSRTEALDSLAVSTWRHMKQRIADQVFNEVVFFAYLKSKGKLQTHQGGKYIETPVSYAENDTVGWISDQDAVNINDIDPLTTAEYDWRYLVASVTRSQIEEQKNRGKMQIINLLKHKMEVAQNSLVKEIEARLYGGADATGKAMEGLQHLVQDDPTSSTTVGKINQSTSSWWRNKTLNYGTDANFGNNDSRSSAGANVFGAAHASGPDKGIVAMREMKDNCSKSLGNEKPDIILTDYNIYRAYNASIDDHLRIVTQKVGDLSFQTLTFEGLPILPSDNCPKDTSSSLTNGTFTATNPGSRIYMLDTDHIYAYYDPGMYFDMTEWKPVPNQLKRAAQIVTAMNMIACSRRSSAVIHNCFTAAEGS
jgi:hypothetical protein|tara:strand:+ start:1227 stop:2333 length:1107 start_codon:yes stop_codon:yes gene_type:complete